MPRKRRPYQLFYGETKVLVMHGMVHLRNGTTTQVCKLLEDVMGRRYCRASMHSLLRKLEDQDIVRSWWAKGGSTGRRKLIAWRFTAEGERQVRRIGSALDSLVSGKKWEAAAERVRKQG